MKIRNKKIKNNKELKTLTYTLMPDIKDNPVELEDKLTNYLESDKVKNIAINGVYGSGKTSFWLSYVYNNKKVIKPKEIITIALGNYHKENKTTFKLHDDKEISNDNIRLEKQILNQIASQIPNRKIPLSKYSLLKNKPWWFKLLNSFFVSSFLSIIFLWNFENKIINLFNISKNSITIIYIFLFAIFIILFCYFLMFSTPLRFKRFKFENMELEKESNFMFTELSPLDKDINEIVYMLRYSKSKVVVFEDLDRYEDITIFEKLKEINFIVNNLINKKRTIKFIYMIHDGLFKNPKDRTKFFDAIIPIVPNIDVNNSLWAILYLLKSEKKHLNDDVIWKLSFYINDMRIIKNIINEYVCYKTQIRIDEIELDPNKLFAFIVFKNLFPDKFDLILKDDKETIKLLNNILEGKSVEQIESQWESFIYFLKLESLIDESYYLYKSTFKENGFSTSDHFFLKNILENKENEPLYKLDNPNIIINRLEESYFERKGMINKYILLEFVRLREQDQRERICFFNICNNKCFHTLYKTKFEKFLNTISNLNLQDHFGEIISSFNEQEIKGIILVLCWENLIEKFINITRRPIITGDIAVKINDYGMPRFLAIFYKNRDYMFKIEEFWKVCREKIERNIEILTYLNNQEFHNFIDDMQRQNLKFYSIDNYNLGIYNIQCIEQKQLYKLTAYNVRRIYEFLHNEKISYENLLEKVKNSKKMVETNKFIYTDNFIVDYIACSLDYNTLFKNDESILVKILNSDISKEIKNKYVSNNLTILSKLSKINDINLNKQSIDTLFKNNCIKPSNENIRSYLEATIDFPNHKTYISDEFIKWLETKINLKNYSKFFLEIDNRLIKLIVDKSDKLNRIIK
ncbi:hypothetical protein [Mycoplasma leachii]|uniref:Putative transmembrane protein n=1 Tax=Mycoplasma leachii 06049 TaxID=1188244 RepID=A0A2T4I8Z3_9MOLU|nr:hypothetical protein [Mycoplasma leachii]PTD30986.1 putative transmembrane protein [Mycoplasma leachii 06049]